jgi:protein-disulfide isomerase
MAQLAAEYAECARRQDRFWELHDTLFSQSVLTALSRSSLGAAFERVGLSPHVLDGCREQPDVTAVVAEDLRLASELGIASTPTFLIGTPAGEERIAVREIIHGSKPLQVFRDVIHAIEKNREVHEVGNR